MLNVFLISGTTPRGDTGGGPNSACKQTGPWIPVSLRVNICQDLQLLGLTAGREAMLSGAAVVLYRYSMLVFDIKKICGQTSSDAM